MTHCAWSEWTPTGSEESQGSGSSSEGAVFALLGVNAKEPLSFLAP